MQDSRKREEQLEVQLSAARGSLPCILQAEGVESGVSHPPWRAVPYTDTPLIFLQVESSKAEAEGGAPAAKTDGTAIQVGFISLFSCAPCTGRGSG